MEEWARCGWRPRQRSRCGIAAGADNRQKGRGGGGRRRWCGVGERIEAGQRCWRSDAGGGDTAVAGRGVRCDGAHAQHFMGKAKRTEFLVSDIVFARAATSCFETDMADAPHARSVRMWKRIVLYATGTRVSRALRIASAAGARLAVLS